MALFSQERVDTSPTISDEVHKTTCYMCACRCGIRVHVRNGQVRYIEGNPDHPVNKGVLCGKGSAGIMQHLSPARLTNPLRRVGPRGSGEYEEVSWDEALELATKWLGDCRRTDPRRLAFFTGRDQSQSLTAFWATKFGTPNHAAHGGFCSVNMAAAGLYTIGGSFWEFGEPDWELTRYFMMFGVAEDHDSNPIKTGLGRLKSREDAKFVSINPVRTGYSAIADEWIGIRPGTDGLFVMALIHELIKAQKVDLDFLVRYTNAPWLVREEPGHPEHGLFLRDEEGHPLAWDRDAQGPVSALLPDISPALGGQFTLPDGTTARPAFELMAARYIEPQYSADVVEDKTGIPAATIRRIAAELAHAAFEQEIELDIEWTDWAGRKHDKMIGRPVSMHAMRGISAHSNGFHTCRAIHLLQMLLGSIDCPGGFRYKPPFPRPCPPGPKPTGKPEHVTAGEPMPGPPLGFTTGPEDLLVDEDGNPCRIDKGFSWEHPLSAHGLMHMVIHNAWAADPHPVDTLFLYMANMAWNSSMNTKGTMEMLTDVDDETGEYRIPHIIYSDAYASEMTYYADLVLPDTSYLERWDCISLLDRPISTAHGPADSIRHPIIDPGRNVRPFQDVLIDLGARLGLPGFAKEDGSALYPGGYSDYIVNHERTPGIGPLAGWRGENGETFGRGAPNPAQLDKYIENGGFWQHHLPESQQYYKHANRDYLEFAAHMGFIPKAEQVIMQIYSEPMQKFRLAAEGHGAIQPPDHLRERVQRYFDPLPIWYQPIEEAMVDLDDYPIHAITQRPMAMYHSWGSQNAWSRQIHGYNRLCMSRDLATDLGVEDDDWVYVESHNGRIRCQVRTMNGVERNTVWTWNAIGKRRGAWNLDIDADEGEKGFLLNHLISELLPEKTGGRRMSNSDPVTGQAAWFDLRVKIRKAEDDVNCSEPQFEPLHRVPGEMDKPEDLRFGEEFLPEDSWRRKRS
ncbi:MAG: molybdopterin-dependent oxidoreductase [Xanthomonadales bacterium]|nr:molybdopterin oxidoreductase family protein [Gammaproteobacteria bacterium]MBT8051629.1 molybdopterin oxidoreductase family protein [Gammaproteobacteria bacterium]MBT8057674.1 molybdopterin oxidoreductase family protein [Gammaproteobacteria bacterium]NNJ77734.1 molybdopterin-dependent oxidoreductase [Xanthomonadales bacterium]NNL04937.1 molybdopterin-dependent oxidoreductase [Xanthomonadales bacterium]